MIYGIEETTDRRSPETKIVRLASERAAQRWLAQGGGLAWPGAADSRLPISQQNHHRRLRDASAMPPRWRPPSPVEIAMLRARARDWRTSDLAYVARAIRRDRVREIPAAPAGAGPRPWAGGAVPGPRE